MSGDLKPYVGTLAVRAGRDNGRVVRVRFGHQHGVTFTDLDSGIFHGLFRPADDAAAPFDQALVLLRDGMRVRRRAWGPKQASLMLIGEQLRWEAEGGSSAPAACLLNDDILAHDWVVAP